jgi:hypothetical protein
MSLSLLAAGCFYLLFEGHVRPHLEDSDTWRIVASGRAVQGSARLRLARLPRLWLRK